ncbi:MAG: MCP four helix bundle domain-containing protein [Deltaproteobacteria bacterium]|nr:MCP four helix bundle domain-containing protein [Deltaproteobacteria bacterium]
MTNLTNLYSEEFKSAQKANDVSAMAKAGELIQLIGNAAISMTNWHYALRTHIDASDDAAMDALENEMKGYRKNIDQALSSLKTSDKGQEHLNAASQAIDDFQKHYQQVVKLSRINSNVRSAELTVNQKPKLVAACDAALGKLTEQMKNEMTEEQLVCQNKVNKSVWTLALVGGLGILLGLTLAIIIVRKTTRTINQIVEGLSNASDQVAAASNQVASASQSLAEGSSEQAAAVEETSSSMEEMASMTKQNADNANQADALAKEAKKVTIAAGDSMTRLTDSMNEISKASEETSKIIKTIDEIAFQTNLLALNAAVEAARAGEAGAGFAVVADEVRNLAMRAADAAKSTSNLIDDTGKKVKDGTALVSVTSQAFAQVADSASKVAELVGEIAAASKEQAQGIEQSNRAISEVEKVTQQNASTAEESASASEELNAQAVQLKNYVMELMALVGGKVHSREVKKSREESAVPVRLPRPTYPVEKAKEVRLIKGNVDREVRPERVIPMDDGDFKDF